MSEVPEGEVSADEWADSAEQMRAVYERNQRIKDALHRQALARELYVVMASAAGALPAAVLARSDFAPVVRAAFAAADAFELVRLEEWRRVCEL